MSGSLYTGNRWPLKQRVGILGKPRILLGKAGFVFLAKAQITQKKNIFS